MTKIEWFDAVDDLASRYIATGYRNAHQELGSFLEMIVENRIGAAIELFRRD